MKIGAIILSLFMFGKSCSKDPYYYNQKVWGYKPVYSTNAALKQISIDTPHVTKDGGKIYVYQNYILQCETGEGIHVIDNSNALTAKKIAFIKALGANEISIKNNFLYTNCYKDLVVIDITNILQPVEVKRISNAFSVKGYLPVPPVKTYYECVDLSKGVVVGWQQDSVYYSCSNF